MKIKRLSNLRPAALAVMGVFLGRGAQADTVIDFDTVSQSNNTGITRPFGDYAEASNEGVTVTGFGTPNIGVNWVGMGDPATRWEYYTDSVWTAGQLNHSVVGTANEIVFMPNNATASVVIKSFNFFPYYDFATYNERFTYDVSVLSGNTVVSGPQHLTFQSDATKNHPVTINFTGAPGQTLKLRMARVPSVLTGSEVEGFGGDIAADDITFAQLPASKLPAGPQLASVTPADEQEGVAAINYSYLAGITNGDMALDASSIRLKLDGAALTPTVTSAGDQTNVSYTAASPLPSNSLHLYTLTYADTLGAVYTNEVSFRIANYPTLPSSFASPPGSGSHRGFLYRTVVATQDITNTLASTIARANAQLNGTLIDPGTGLPYTNAIPPGTNADGSFTIDGVLNFNDNGTAAGNFPDDTPFPGLDSGIPSNWFSTEALLNLELAPGYYRFGVNSDDGFEFSAQPPGGSPDSPIVLGLFDNGRAAANTLFDFTVQTAGVYPFRLVYFESGGDASCELFSVDPSTANMILINDPANSNAIKSYSAIPPTITSATRNGSNLQISWSGGTPPFQLQVKSDLNNPVWNNSGTPTTSRTAQVPIDAGAGFIRIAGSP